VFNRGHPGIGTNLLLAQAEEDFFKLEKSFDESTFVYLMPEPLHTNRNVGRIPSIHWTSMRPYYYLHQGEVVRDGSFLSGRPVRTWIYLQMMSVLEYFGWSMDALFPRVREEDRQLTCRLVDRLRSQINLRHPKAKFVVYLLGNSEEKARNVPCFKERSIPFILSRVPANEDYEIPIDGHPNLKATESIAKDISENLEEFEVQ